MILSRVLAATAAIVFMSTAAFARSTSGIAYDSVTTLVPSSDPPLRPEDFASDFRAGQHPSQSCIPSLIRRYVTTRKERIEDVCKREATIVDCNTRTATMLDFTNKTYGSLSLDAKYVDASTLSAHPADDYTSTIAIERAGRGRKVVGGRPTDEYTESDEQSIVDSESSITSLDRWNYYFAPKKLPELACIDVAAPWLSRYGASRQYEPELQQYLEAQRSKWRNSRYVVSESGPKLPAWRIVLYSVWERFQRQSGVADFTYFFKLESGNIRSIDDDDAAFTLPSGFTKL